MIATLLEGPYGLLIKILAPILLAVGIFAFGFYEGDKHVTTIYKAKIVNHVIVQTKAISGETKVIHDKVVQIQIVHDKASVAIAALPDNRACDLDPATVGLLNANRGTLPPSP